MATFVALIYFALPCVLIFIAVRAIVRIVRRPRDGDHSRDLIALGAAGFTFIAWYAMAGRELVSEWEFEHEGDVTVLHGPQSAGDRGYLCVWLVPDASVGGSRTTSRIPAVLSLNAKGNVRRQLDGRAPRIRVAEAVLGGRTVATELCTWSEGPEGFQFAYAITGHECSEIPFGGCFDAVHWIE